MQHWKQHKVKCTDIKKIDDNWKEERSKTLPDGSALDTKEGPCAICLEETITNPVVLPCGHAFCFACVGKYQQTSESDEASCPYCRGVIPDVVERSFERGKLYLGRAMTLPKGSEEQKKYAKLALAEIDSFNEVFTAENDQALYILMLRRRAFMMTFADMPEETIKVTKELLSLHKTYPDVLDFDSKAQIISLQAGAYLECGMLNNAKEGYKSFFTEHMLQGKRPNAGSVINLCRVFYEMNDYQTAIVMGNAVIETSRYIAGVHKYVALSHKAQGNVEEAKQLISRAILYEAHWNKGNLQQNKEILKELNNL